MAGFVQFGKDSCVPEIYRALALDKLGWIIAYLGNFDVKTMFADWISLYSSGQYIGPV